MKVLVVGVGAVGSVYLALLSRSGHSAVGLVKKGRRIENIRVDGIWGQFAQEVKTIDNLRELPFEPELTILTVKSYDTEEALKLIEPLKSTTTLLMVAQNGYGNYEKAIGLFGSGKVILARVIFGAELSDWGRVRVTVCGDDVVLGDPSGLIEEQKLKELAGAFTESGIPTRYEKEVYKYLWDKILYNCALNPLGALFETTYGQLAGNPYTKKLMDKILDEAFEVIRVNSIPTFWSCVEDYKEHFYKRLIPPTADHYPSMLRDIKRGKTEIDALNGALLELAKGRRLSLPVNEMLVDLIKARELFNQPSKL